MRVSLKSVACVLFAIAFVSAPTALSTNAQDQPSQVDIFESCLNLTTGGSDYTITNNCGVKVHAYWGFYDKATERGIIQFSGEIDAGETTKPAAAFTNLRAIGCPFTPSPGHPLGYTLTYKDHPSGIVGSYQGANSLVCVL